MLEDGNGGQGKPSRLMRATLERPRSADTRPHCAVRGDWWASALALHERHSEDRGPVVRAHAHPVHLVEEAHGLLPEGLPHEALRALVGQRAVGVVHQDVEAAAGLARHLREERLAGRN